MANHTILGGKVHIYKRPNSRFWQCCTWLAGRNRRTTTKQESLQLAKEFAEDWYLGLRDKNRSGELVNEKTCRSGGRLLDAGRRIDNGQLDSGVPGLVESVGERADRWRLYRVHFFVQRPRIFTLAPPIDSAVHLSTETWRASFSSAA